jgi:hypothetical protein
MASEDDTASIRPTYLSTMSITHASRAALLLRHVLVFDHDGAQGSSSPLVSYVRMRTMVVAMRCRRRRRAQAVGEVYR